MCAAWKCYVAFGAFIVCCVGVAFLMTKLLTRECMSSKCHKKGRLILDEMDDSVAPCDNFYQFVCGNYERLTKNGEDKSVWDSMKEKQLEKAASLLDPPSRKGNDRVLRVLKLVYQACLNTEKIDSEGIQPLLNNIQHSGGFPLVEGEKWIKQTGTSRTKWAFDQVEYKTRLIGFKGGHLFSAYVARYPKDDGQFYIHLSPPSRTEYQDSDRDGYYKYMKKITTLLKANDTGNVDKEIDDTIAFYKKLAEITHKEENCSTSLHNETIQSFSEEFPFLSLKTFLENMNPYVNYPSHMLVYPNTRQYFTDIKGLMDNSSERALANFMMIENIKEVTPILPTEFREAYAELQENTKNHHFKPEKNRKIVCVNCLKSKVNSAISALYLKTVIKKYTRPDYLSPTIKLMKKELINTVYEFNWMDEETKYNASEKIKRMDFASPVPEEDFRDLTNKTKFRVYYEDLCFTGNTTDTLTAYLALQRFKSDKNWELLERPEEIYDNNVDIFLAEIYYNYRLNKVVIPMGYLTYPAYDQRWPNFLNYGGFGSKVAMELARGIGETGSKFDVDGKLKTWWSTETRAEYRKFPSCYMSRYNTYLTNHTEKRVTDHNCVPDAAAGPIGVRVAFGSYVMYSQQRFFGERNLRGLAKYSPRQMFFIDFATFHCAENKSYHNGTTEKELGDEAPEYKCEDIIPVLVAISKHRIERASRTVKAYIEAESAIILAQTLRKLEPATG